MDGLPFSVVALLVRLLLIVLMPTAAFANVTVCYTVGGNRVWSYVKTIKKCKDLTLNPNLKDGACYDDLVVATPPPDFAPLEPHGLLPSSYGPLGGTFVLGGLGTALVAVNFDGSPFAAHIDEGVVQSASVPGPPPSDMDQTVIFDLIQQGNPIRLPPFIEFQGLPPLPVYTATDGALVYTVLDQSNNVITRTIDPITVGALSFSTVSQVSLIVSNNGNSELSFFTSAGAPTSTPTSGTSPFAGAGTSFEGEACSASSTYQTFVANNGPSIYIYTVNTATGGGLWNIAPFVTIPGASFTSLALYGSTLYAADYGDNLIYAFTTGPSSVTSPTYVSPVLTYGVHDVVVDPSGTYVYATNFQNTAQGVTRLGSTLSASPVYNLISNPSGYRFAGMTFDGSGDLWVSNFGAVGTNQPGVFEFAGPSSKFAGATPLATITNSLFNNPLGLAYNPADGNIYVANFTADSATSGANSVLEINTTGDTVAAFISSGLSHPKYLGFLSTCAAPNGYVEVCKSLSATNPAPAGVYSFTVEGNATNPVMVPSGECSGPISASSPTATITEALTPGVSATVTAIGYSPPTYTQEMLLDNFIAPGTATVYVVPGNTSTQTLVTFTNYEAPPAMLKICKIGGAGVAGNSFEFQTVNIMNPGSGYTSAPTVTFSGCTTEPTAVATVSGGLVTGITMTSLAAGCAAIPPAPVVKIMGGGGTGATASFAVVSVEAGLMQEGGYCQVVSGSFEVGTTGAVAENLGGLPPPLASPVPAYGVSGITVNGAPATGTKCGGNPCVMYVIGPGVNEVSFTNVAISQGMLGGGGLSQDLAIVNYSLVRQVATAGTQSYMTYRADLLNTGAPIPSPLIARLSSLNPSSVQVVGQGELNFASAPANSQIASSNTFTILTDPTVPVDFSSLSWAYYSRRSVPSRR